MVLYFEALMGILYIHLVFPPPIPFSMSRSLRQYQSQINMKDSFFIIATDKSPTSFQSMTCLSIRSFFVTNPNIKHYTFFTSTSPIYERINLDSFFFASLFYRNNMTILLSIFYNHRITFYLCIFSFV